MDTLIFYASVVLLGFILGFCLWHHVKTTETKLYQPPPLFPVKGFARDIVPVSGIYRDVTYEVRQVFKRGDTFPNSYSFRGRSLWVEIQRLETEPTMDKSLVDEIENLLD